MIYSTRGLKAKGFKASFIKGADKTLSHSPLTTLYTDDSCEVGIKIQWSVVLEVKAGKGGWMDRQTNGEVKNTVYRGKGRHDDVTCSF